MSTLTHPFGRSGFDAPRLTLRRTSAWIVTRLLALDARRRERGNLATMDARMLRDIGVTMADVDHVLRRPDAHLRSILLRGVH